MHFKTMKMKNFPYFLHPYGKQTLSEKMVKSHKYYEHQHCDEFSHISPDSEFQIDCKQSERKVLRMLLIQVPIPFNYDRCDEIAGSLKSIKFLAG